MDFSIITPSFRQLDYLACCICSVADQEGVTLEHIIQDAGTPGFDDFSSRMGELWPHRDGYRRTMISEKDRGMYDAVNRGLKKARGNLLAYLNCDEQYLPGTLLKVKEIFEKSPSTQILCGGIVVVNPAGRLISLRAAVDLSLPHVMVSHLPNFTGAMFFRRELITKEDAWFRETLRDLGDAVWVIERLKAKSNFRKTKEILTSFTDTGANMNLSANARREAKELRASAPLWMRFSRPLWVLQHRIKKIKQGAYWPRSFSFQIYLRGKTDARSTFISRWANPLWFSRLILKNP